MSNIEPTEEQMQKGEQMYASSDYMTSRDFAEILAEREAKLREEMAEHRFYREQGAEERDTLRARVAELEAFTLLTDSERTSAMFAAGLDVVTRAVREADQLHQTVGGGTRHYVNECLLPCFKDEGIAIIVVDKAHAIETGEREAQHLADIKALRVHIVSTESGDHDHFDESMDFDGCPACESARILAATAHYDDAKAGAPASTEGGEG